MMAKQRTSTSQHHFKILAVFALAFTLQGLSLAIFHSDRHAPETARAGSSSVSNGARIMATNSFSVTNTNDSGPGSLRQAITDANQSPGHDEIRFLFAGPVTFNPSGPFVINDSLSIAAHGPWLTDTNPGWVTVDLAQLQSLPAFHVSDAAGTSIRRLRLINGQGYGILVSGASAGTAIISNTIQTGGGGIRLTNTSHITITHNALVDIDETGVDIDQSSNLWLIRNRILAGDAAIELYDSVSDVLVISNTLSGIPGFGTVGIRALGIPAATGIQMRNNYFSDTFQAVSLGPDVNNGFPAPKIIDSEIPITQTATIRFRALSPADPFSYTYPLSMDVYRVRDGNYTPLARSVQYQAGRYPFDSLYTLTGVNLLSTDQLALAATTANPSTSEFSEPFDVTPSALLYVKAFLEGPYSTQNHEMDSDLAGSGALPLSQPFSDQAYDGTVLDFDSTQSVVSHRAKTTDWLLASLRLSTDSASTIATATQAALIAKDGTVVTGRGDSLLFPGIPDGAYYLVLRSRNHLDIMSDSAIVVSGSVGSHDFTLADTSAFGDDPQKMLEAGVWGMFAGDESVDGQVTAVDFNAWLVATKAVATGYVSPDFNLDEQVTASDFNLWLVNTKLVATSKVP